MNYAEFTIAMSSVLMGVCIYSLLVTHYSEYKHPFATDNCTYTF